jgi:hypothetical protein
VRLSLKVIRKVGFCLALSFLIAQASALAGGTSSPKLSKEDEEKLKQLPAAKEKKKDEPVELIVAVNVPRNVNATDEFNIYPYPVDLMKTEPPSQISTDSEYLRELIRSIVYDKNGRIDKPVPNDWRIQWAFEHALKLAGKDVPMSIAGADQWAQEMVPYMRTEINTIEVIEDKRWQRYKTKAADCEAGRSTWEEQATNKGLGPLNLSVLQYGRGEGLRQGHIYLQENPWWVVGKHEVPGLTYYWDELINIGVQGPRFIELNERNAVVIKSTL